MERKLRITRRCAFALEVLAVFVLQGTPRLIPPILGNTPSLLICVALTVALFENEICAVIFGLVCGALTDLGFSNRIGYFTVMLGIICCFISYFAGNIFVTSLLNAVLCSVFVIFVLFSVYFLLFHYLSLRYDNAGIYYVRHFLIRIAYTSVFIPPFYWLNKIIRRRS